MIYLDLKLALMFIGAPLALAARPLGAPWLFYVGLGLLLVALILPARRGQQLGERISNLARHLPGARWLGRGREERRADENG